MNNEMREIALKAAEHLLETMKGSPAAEVKARLGEVIAMLAAAAGEAR